MKKFFWIAAFIALISLFVFMLLDNWERRKTGKVCFNNYCFNVRLAVTTDEKAKGLMYEKELGDNEGMLFVYDDEGEYGYWMKNTLIPLDIIWIDRDKKRCLC